MKRSVAFVLTLALVGAAPLLGGAAAAASSKPPALNYRAVCPARPGVITCRALVRTDVRGLAKSGDPNGYGPAELQDAYNLPSGLGDGVTVAITGQGGYSLAESDLAAYRSMYGLPACKIKTGCLTIVNQEGQKKPLPPDNRGWWGESALDMDMVSAACPLCKILYVESNMQDGDTGLLTSINTAVSLGATIVTNSWGEYDSQAWGDAEYRKYFYHPGAEILFASGDIGYGSAQPDSKLLVMVGSTTLTQAKNKRGWSESVWRGSTSWCSVDNKTARWMPQVGCSGRLMVDLATDGDPATGVAVYVAGQWRVEGGTSASSPFVAGIYALGGRASKLRASRSLYRHPEAFFDVTTGSDGTCSPPIFCEAGPGYDAASGLGTPNGIAAFR
jgi:subtilase family serine protease